MDVEKIIKNVTARKQFKGMLLTTGDDHHLVYDKLPFGIDYLDSMLKGGIPCGRVTLVYGDFSSGKSFLALNAIRSAQGNNKSVVLIDTDRSYDLTWAKTVGVDIANLVVARPNHGEQAFDLAVSLVEDGIDLVIMDTMDALIAINEAEENMEEIFIGAQARMIAKGLRKIIRINQKTAFLAISHVREGFGRFASKRIPGGKAQEEMASLMLLVSKGAAIKEDDKRVGFNMRIMIEKDKIHGKLYESCELPFRFEGGGIDTMSGLFQLGMDAGAIVQHGPRYEILGHKLIGKLNVIELIRSNEDIQRELKDKIKTIGEERNVES